MSAKLTGRDIRVIIDVYKYRYLTLAQIERLHFRSKLPCYRRLHVLTELGYLKAFTSPNIAGRIFYLDKKGAEIVAIELHVALENLQWYRYSRAPKDYYFLRHFLAINDFRILITLASQQNGITLLGFIPEYVGEKTREGYVKKYIRDRVCDIGTPDISYSHTPDAVFALEKNDKAALFFVEIDRGIEIVSDPAKGFLKSVVFYLNYWTDKKWQRYETEFNREFKTFRALIVTTSQERLKHMREAVTNYPFPDPYAKRFLWGSTNGQVTITTLFDPIWLSLDISDSTVYRIG